MKLHAAGRPIPRADLPDPPGFAPIPISDTPQVSQNILAQTLLFHALIRFQRRQQRQKVQQQLEELLQVVEYQQPQLQAQLPMLVELLLLKLLLGLQHLLQKQ